MKLMKEHGTWYVSDDHRGRLHGSEGGHPGIFSAAGRGESHSGRAAGQNAHEFELMVQAGMSPLFTIQTATVHAAQLLKRDKDLCSITAGKLADLGGGSR